MRAEVKGGAETLLQTISTIRGGDIHPTLEALAGTALKLRDEVLVPRSPSSLHSLKPLLIREAWRGGGMERSRRLNRSLGEKRMVVGIDSTSIPLAESMKGILIAARATLVARKSSENYVERVGPILAYLTEETMEELKEVLSISPRVLKMASVDPRYSGRVVMMMLERWLLWNAALSFKDSIILVDGSLSLSSIELRDQPIRRIIQEARARGNTIIGVSKRSMLFKLCSRDLMGLACGELPAAMEIEEASHYLRHCTTRVLFAFLSTDLIPLRIDVPLSEERPFQALEGLISSDQISNGYPETLRQAHVFSKLSKTERLGLKLGLRLFDARLIESERERNILFGAFNRSTREWMTGNADLR